MAKENHVIKMIGVLADGTPAKTHQADDVALFTNEKRTVKVCIVSGRAHIKTAKGQYTLNRSITGDTNKYVGKCGDIITHFTHKKIVGKLIYWV